MLPSFIIHQHTFKHTLLKSRNIYVKWKIFIYRRSLNDTISIFMYTMIQISVGGDDIYIALLLSLLKRWEYYMFFQWDNKFYYASAHWMIKIIYYYAHHIIITTLCYVVFNKCFSKKLFLFFCVCVKILYT